MPRAGPEEARREVRGSGRITQSSGRSDVEVSSFKEAFDHFIGKGGRRGTKEVPFPQKRNTFRKT